MNCSLCRDVVFDVARGVVNPDEAAALGHASGCAACSRYLQQQRELTAGLRALAIRDEVPSGALEQRLKAALKAAPAAPAPASSRWARGAWLKIAAAIVVACSAILVWQWHRPQEPVSSVRNGPHVSTPSTRTTAVGAPGAPQATVRNDAVAREEGGDGQPAAARPVVKPARRRIVQATGFVALPAAATLPPFERGEIVRVRVRLASLTKLGFAVQPDAADDTPVNADVLVAQDGQPRAIRLVTTESQYSRSRR